MTLHAGGHREVEFLFCTDGGDYRGHVPKRAQGAVPADGPLLRAVYRGDADAVAEEEGNALVSAKMDDLIESFSKAIWMISQSLMA